MVWLKANFRLSSIAKRSGSGEPVEFYRLWTGKPFEQSPAVINIGRWEGPFGARQRVITQSACFAPGRLNDALDLLGLLDQLCGPWRAYRFVRALDNEGHNQIRSRGSGCSSRFSQSGGRLRRDVQNSRGLNTPLLPEAGSQHL
jgi:hypothetical protein